MLPILQTVVATVSHYAKHSIRTFLIYGDAEAACSVNQLASCDLLIRCQRENHTQGQKICPHTCSRVPPSATARRTPWRA
uniref:Uncharacterized protein n=1 Tax=Paramormyrops kingsleyae TaxID=1676925 RepID=A0A3B3S2U3_9TELE